MLFRSPGDQLRFLGLSAPILEAVGLAFLAFLEMVRSLRRHGLDIVGEQDFWTRCIPGDHSGGDEKIADDYIIRTILNKLAQFPGDLRLAVFTDRVRMGRKRSSQVLQKLGCAFRRVQLQRNTNYALADRV